MKRDDPSGIVFRLRIVYLIPSLTVFIGSLAVLILMVLGVLDFPSDIIRTILYFVNTALLLGATIDFFIARVTVRRDGLSYQRLFIKKEMCWEQIDSIELSLDDTFRKVMVLSNAGTHIWLDERFRDYIRLRDMALRCCPNSKLSGKNTI